MTTKRSSLSEHEKIYSAGHLLFEQDEPGHRMYIIKRGQVRIYRTLGSEDLMLALLGPGEFFGEMALLESLPRSASARCEKTCLLVEIDGDAFGEMVKDNAEIAVRLMCKLAGRVRELDQRLERLYEEQGTGRAVEVLGFMLPASGPLTVSEATLHKTIYDKTGLMPWQIDATLAELDRLNCVKIADGTVEVTSRDDLKDYARFLDLGRKYERASQELPGSGPSLGMERLVRALDLSPDEMARSQTVLAQHYQDYLELKRRFQPAPPPPG